MFITGRLLFIFEQEAKYTTPAIIEGRALLVGERQYDPAPLLFAKSTRCILR